ncbi:MAG: MogA/MoaB family molybdenum cofactor biosynthesis protein [Actinomycetia bacterium]|nr:MogA/MoaB family molybdenum cofactor biosynthesis protein [Actinomycetes bacterium]
MRVGILTLSDKGFKKEREDKSGKIIQEMMEIKGYEVKYYEVLPDEELIIEQKIKHLCDNKLVDIVLTTGGTGFSQRDVTPEATLKVIEKHVPGFAEAMRLESLKITPMAMLSRGVSGIRGQTLIVNLPGSPKAVKECLEVIIPALEHGIEILKGKTGECGEG